MHFSPARKAQTMMEYLLVMIVVVVIVFLAFKNSGQSVINRTAEKTAEYFDTGATAITGGYWDGDKFVRVEPNAINGGWCAWTTCIEGYKSRECACPRPAFGGAACEGDAVVADDCGGYEPPPVTCYTYRCHHGGWRRLGHCQGPCEPNAYLGDYIEGSTVCVSEEPAANCYRNCGDCCTYDYEQYACIMQGGPDCPEECQPN